MSDGSNIEWTEATWNPVVGCRRVSAGCQHCYAETMAHRLASMGQKRYQGLTVLHANGMRRWSGEVRLVPEALDKPLRWRKPRLVFVNSMSDLFHEDVPFAYIAAVFGVMAASPQHTFQVLTKRPERMLEWFRWVREEGYTCNPPTPGTACVIEAQHATDGDLRGRVSPLVWPLPNVWVGVSCENQEAADERIPVLLQCPAAVRWVSAEPLLGPIDLDPPRCSNCGDDEIVPASTGAPAWCTMCDSEASFGHWMGDVDRELGWIVVGGESGPGARACDTAWVRSIVEQCQSATVPVFVKQLGACPTTEHAAADDASPQAGGRLTLKHRKGGDISEWPEDLRVRQMPGRVE